MPDLDGLPDTRPLPRDIYAAEIERVFKSRGVLFAPETVVMFRVLDPDPDTSPENSKHVHKAFAGRTITARFELASENKETRHLAARQLGYLVEAINDKGVASAEELVGEYVRVRVDYVTRRSDPSRSMALAVEFLPYEF